MKFIIGTKEEMTQIFDEEGNVLPVTIIKTGDLVVTQVKEKEKDGYMAIQVGFGERNIKNINKAQQGHFKDLGNFRSVKEFRVSDDKNDKKSDLKRGDKVGISQFESGDKVSVRGTSKGKGFQGVVKRHGFAGGRRTHGQKHSEREPGSIGSTGPQRVFKGTRMGGRMGGEKVFVKNLTVAKVDPEGNLIYIKGAVPGRRGTLVEIMGI